MGLLAAILDAIHGEDDRIAGVEVTRLTTPLLEAEVATLNVESAVKFGENVDGANDALLLVNGEIIRATGRTLTTFTGLTRGVGNTKVPTVHPVTTLVYDFSQNKSALDRLRRGFILDDALGSDIDVLGRNLGVDKCDGLTDDQWKEIIRRVAYMPKQPIDSFRQVLDVVFPGNYDIVTRLVSKPYTVRVNVGLADAVTKEGRFLLNSGEPQDTTGLTSVDVDYPILSSPHVGEFARGFIRVVAGGFLVDDTDTFTIDDGVNPPVTFVYDDDASIVATPVLRPIAFLATDSEQQVRSATSATINAAPTLDVTATFNAADNVVDLTNDAAGVAGNVAILEVVADPVYAINGMVGGIDPGAFGVFGVFDDTPLTRLGHRLGFTNYFTGGSFIGSTITLGSSPGAAGTPVIVDYIAFKSNYLAENENVTNDEDFYAYLGDDTALVRCLLDLVRAAGIKVEVGLKV